MVKWAFPLDLRASHSSMRPQQNNITKQIGALMREQCQVSRRVAVLTAHAANGHEMSLVEALDSRRSVRAFDTARKVPQETVKRILERAMRAPSDVNITPWSDPIHPFIADSEISCSGRYLWSEERPARPWWPRPQLSENKAAHPGLSSQ